MENEQKVCSICHQPVLDEYFYCPNCGNNLKEKLIPVSLAAQLGMYALAIFLPPLGLWPGIKYLSKKSSQAKRVGVITIVLTLIASMATIWAIFSIFNNYISQVNELMYDL